MKLIDSLNWRYATKKMNGQPVSQEKVDYIIDAANLAPTSSGLQPFQIIVITNQALKEKIVPLAFNQTQIADCSHLLVFAAWDDVTPERITRVFKYMNEQRGIPDSATEAYVQQLIAIAGSRTREQNFEHAARQAYIAFGMAIAAAAEQQVDATPMEGFNNAELDELLGLKEKGLKSVTLLPLGYRDESGDWLVNLKKVRKPREELLITLN